jgi:hypothetical protein
MKKLNQASGLAHKVVKTKSTTLSSSRCGSTIFDEIATNPRSCVPDLVVASKIRVYFDV